MHEHMGVEDMLKELAEPVEDVGEVLAEEVHEDEAVLAWDDGTDEEEMLADEPAAEEEAPPGELTSPSFIDSTGRACKGRCNELGVRSAASVWQRAGLDSLKVCR